MNNFYTYFHTRADTGQVFYVGKGKENRAHDTNRNRHWSAIHKKHGRTVHFAMTGLSEAEAFEHEKFLILCFKDMGCNLVNMTDGGDGISGFKHDEKTKSKISKSLVGHPVLNQTKETLSRLLKGRVIHTDESKVKISNAQLGKKKPDSMRKRLSESTKGRLRAHMTPEFMDNARSFALKAVKGVRQSVITCPHCAKSGGVAPMTRWHMENCSSNPVKAKKG
jgi:hypothetical protein